VQKTFRKCISFILLLVVMMQGDVSDSFLNIADLLLSQNQADRQIPPNVLSQISDEDPPIFAGQIETSDGNVIPLTVGQTDIGNGKPVQFIHISEDPSVLSRHLTITTVQTQDGKFRASLRMNFPHGKVQLGGSAIRPDIPYPLCDDDEVVVGCGIKFKFRLNQPTPAGFVARQSVGGPTQHYESAPNSDEIHESEQREKQEKRKQFQERLTPDDSLLMQIATAADPEREIKLVHEAGDTCPYSSSMESQEVDPMLGQDRRDIFEMDGSTPLQPEDDFIMNDDESDLEEQDNPADENIETSAVTDSPEPVTVRDIAGELYESDLNEPTKAAIEGPLAEETVGDEEDVHTEPPEPVIPEEFERNIGEEMPGMRTRSQRSAVAPQLSQEVENIPAAPVQPSPIEGQSLMERVARRMGKRPLTELNIKQEPEDTQNSMEQAGPPVKKRGRGKVSGSQKQSPLAEESNRRSSTRSAVPGRETMERQSEGPKKLIFLKTAIDVDKSTESAVGACGGKFESKWSDRVEALITGSIVRTTKFLCAINRGLSIFPKSILSEIKLNKSLPPTDEPGIWLRDPEGEAKYEFSLKKSILQARKKPLLEGFDVYNYKGGIGEFTLEEFKDLVVTAGGRIVTRLPKTMPENDVEADGFGTIVIGTESNRSSAKTSGVKFLNKIEFLVDACIKQKLDFNCGRVNV
jgi:hypothetical protein